MGLGVQVSNLFVHFPRAGRKEKTMDTIIAISLGLIVGAFYHIAIGVIRINIKLNELIIILENKSCK